MLVMPSSATVGGTPLRAAVKRLEWLPLLSLLKHLASTLPGVDGPFDEMDEGVSSGPQTEREECGRLGGAEDSSSLKPFKLVVPLKLVVWLLWYFFVFRRLFFSSFSSRSELRLSLARSSDRIMLF